MPIVFDCPHCPIKIQVPEAAAGRYMSCPRCDRSVEVPGEEPSPRAGSESPAQDYASAPSRVRAESHPPSRRDEARIEDRPRRGNRRDDDERRYRQDEPSSNPAALGLGIGSLVVGVVSLIPVMEPSLGGVVALPIVILGLILGVIGLVVSFVDRRRSIGLPIAGTAVSALSLAITLGLLLVLSQAPAEREAAARRELEARERTRREVEERETRRREEESRASSLREAARERERLAQLEADRKARSARIEAERKAHLAQLEADRKAQEKRDADEKAARLAALDAATEGLRAYEEAEKGRAKMGREGLAKAELEQARQDKARTEGEANFETTMQKGGLSANDRQYVRSCVGGRLKYDPARDPSKLSLDVTKRLKDGDVGVPRYPKRFLDGVSFGNSADMKIAQIISDDELVIFPGLLCVKGVSTAGLTAGLKDGSRIDLGGVTIVVDGKGTYTNGKGEKENVPRLIAVDFKKVSPVMKSEALKRWLAAKAELAAAKAQVALQAEDIREAERNYQAEVARRKAEIAKLSVR